MTREGCAVDSGRPQRGRPIRSQHRIGSVSLTHSLTHSSSAAVRDRLTGLRRTSCLYGCKKGFKFGLGVEGGGGCSPAFPPHGRRRPSCFSQVEADDQQRDPIAGSESGRRGRCRWTSEQGGEHGRADYEMDGRIFWVPRWYRGQRRLTPTRQAS